MFLFRKPKPKVVVERPLINMKRVMPIVMFGGLANGAAGMSLQIDAEIFTKFENKYVQAGSKIGNYKVIRRFVANNEYKDQEIFSGDQKKFKENFQDNFRDFSWRKWFKDSFRTETVFFGALNNYQTKEDDKDVSFSPSPDSSNTIIYYDKDKENLYFIYHDLSDDDDVSGQQEIEKKHFLLLPKWVLMPLIETKKEEIDKIDAHVFLFEKEDKETKFKTHDFSKELLGIFFYNLIDKAWVEKNKETIPEVLTMPQVYSAMFSFMQDKQQPNSSELEVTLEVENNGPYDKPELKDYLECPILLQIKLFYMQLKKHGISFGPNLSISGNIMVLNSDEKIYKKQNKTLPYDFS